MVGFVRPRVELCSPQGRVTRPTPPVETRGSHRRPDRPARRTSPVLPRGPPGCTGPAWTRTGSSHAGRRCTAAWRTARPTWRSTDVAGFAGLHHVQDVHGFLDQGVRVEAVDLVKIHVVGPQSGQRCVNLLHDRAPRQPAPAASSAHRAEDLGGEHDLVTVGVLADGLAGDLLAGSCAIDVRGVPEGDPQFYGLPEDRLSSFGIQGPVTSGSGSAETHAAEGGTTHRETRSTQAYARRDHRAAWTSPTYSYAENFISDLDRPRKARSRIENSIHPSMQS